MQTVWFDVETTGTNPKEHEIIQLAAVATRGVTPYAEFECKIRFDESKADPEALAMNSYDSEEWEAEAIAPEAAVLKFANFLRPFQEVRMVSKRTGRPYYLARLAGHNVGFDIAFLSKLFEEWDSFLPADKFRPLDTLQLALWYFASTEVEPPENFKLGTLCDYFGVVPIGGEAHDALVDVKMTARLGIRLSASFRSIEGRPVQ